MSSEACLLTAQWTATPIQRRYARQVVRVIADVGCQQMWPFNRSPIRAIPRAVHLYFSSERVIVVAMHRNEAGIYFEQSDPVVLSPFPSPIDLGAAFRRAFDAFEPRDRDLRNMKKTDWPAFVASALRSVKEFERQFVLVQCGGLDASNAAVRASVPHPTHKQVELSVSFNPLLSAEEIGGQLLTLVGLSMPPNNSLKSDVASHAP